MCADDAVVRVRFRPERAAGRHSLDYYEHSLKAWRRQMRAPLAVAALMGLGGGVLVWLFAPVGHYLAAAFLGATEMLILCTRDSPPDFIAKWKRGGEGERRTGKVLARLERDGWRSFHHREAKYGDLDHVVVGPGGVYLLDSKNLHGTLTVEPEGLTASYGDWPRDAYSFSRLAPTLKREAKNLKFRIADTTGVVEYVQSVVVVWGDFLPRDVEQDNVVYVRGDHLRDWLRARPRRLADEDSRLISAGLEAEIIIGSAPPLLGTSG